MDARRVRGWWQRPLPRWAEVVLLVLVLAVAAGFRLYLVGEAPPGPHYDESAAGLDALDVLAGRHTVFSPRSYGREMLFVYVAAPFIAWLGPTRLALRLPIALVGVLTVLSTYLLARELFLTRDRRRAQWTGLLAASFLALSFWHLALNHLSFRANYLPLTETLCFFFLWRAVRTRRLGAYAASGFFLGLSLHTYTSARFLPLVLVLFFAILLLIREGRRWVLSRWRRWFLLAGVALVVAAPLLLYFVTHPDAFLLRAKGVSILSPQLNQGDVLGLVARSVWGNLGLFGWRGDPNWLYNLPGRPGLDPVQALLFWGGLGLCLARWRRPRYLFLPAWWSVMLLPSILAPDPIPHSLRAIATLPAASIVAALALVEAGSFLARRLRRLRGAVPLALGICVVAYLGWTGYGTWHSYFDLWLPREEVYYAYYGQMADLAGQINRDTDREAVYVFPVNYDRRGEDYREYTLELLHDGPVPFRYIVVDDATVAGDLTDICRGKRRVHLVVWTHGVHVDADPRQVLPFFLERAGRQTKARAFRGYRIVSYELPSSQVTFESPDWVSMDANLGGQLSLRGEAHAPEAASGEPAWVALRWQAASQIGTDYKASLRLLDAEGHLVGQSDLMLLSNEHRATSGWTPGRPATTYHLLPSLPATLPGAYRVELVVYDPETWRPLAVLDEAGAPTGQSLDLGGIEIGRPEQPGAVEPETALAGGDLAPGLSLMGYHLGRDRFSPGETMHLALYWHALDSIPNNYVVELRLVDGTGQVAAGWAETPSYPTSAWRAGDRWRDWHALRLAPDTPSDTYQLVVRLAGAGSGREALLTRIEIEGRPRRFEVPAIEHPQATRLGEAIRFLGFDLGEREVRAGETLRLTLYWQALAETDTSYTVFTHLLGAESRIWGQQDQVPAGGAAPTTGWVPGEVLVDAYEIPVRADAPPGEYALEVGMYELTTAQRLPVYDPAGQPLGDHVLLDVGLTVLP